MEAGHFYYIEDQYFIDFPDVYLMHNKEMLRGNYMIDHVFILLRIVRAAYTG